MNILNNFPINGDLCPICNGDYQDATALVKVHENEEEVVAVHITCIINNLQYSPKLNLMGLETVKL